MAKLINPSIHNVDVLLVEDSSSDAKLVKRAFDKYNLANKFFWVRDGEEALDFMFARNQYKERDIADFPKVVLLDLKMPKVNGVEVLKTLKTDVRTVTIPIVMMTSSKEEQDIMKSYELGANSYIVKPVDFDKFMESIKDVGFYWLFTNQPPK